MGIERCCAASKVEGFHRFESNLSQSYHEKPKLSWDSILRDTKGRKRVLSMTRIDVRRRLGRRLNKDVSVNTWITMFQRSGSNGGPKQTRRGIGKTKAHLDQPLIVISEEQGRKNKLKTFGLFASGIKLTGEGGREDRPLLLYLLIAYRGINNRNKWNFETKNYIPKLVSIVMYVNAYLSVFYPSFLPFFFFFIFYFLECQNNFLYRQYFHYAQ